MKKQAIFLVALSALCLLFFVSAAQAADQPIKIGTINIQDVVEGSKAGKDAQKIFEEKVLAFQSKFQKEKEDIDLLKEEIQKKSSVWDADVKARKEREYQRRMREFQLKNDDYKYEMNQLEQKLMGPIFKDIQQIIAEVGKKEGFTVIYEYSKMSSRIGLLYADDSLDISEKVRKQLDERFKKKK